MSHYYTDEINTLILISLLKEHGIKKIIASPGATNISFVSSVQIDPYFELYSAVDERSASFMALGLAEESGEPVVLTCTGATASRNYLPGLTEAFYRHLPILAVTSTQHTGRVGNYVAQVVDRSRSFPDVFKESCELPTVCSEEERQNTITKVNEILLELRHHTWGPCLINLCTNYSNQFNVTELPKVRVIQRIIDSDFPQIPAGKIGIFIGAHQEFTPEETGAIDSFCSSHNALVICDQISNYRGKFRFLANFVNSQPLDLGFRAFDLIIYIGYVHGCYINFSGKELWRVNPDGVIRDPYRNLTFVFEMSELSFFRHYSGAPTDCGFLKECHLAAQTLYPKIPDLPFSNMWIAKETAHKLPSGSILHLSILNTLRVWNYFETPESVLCFSNSGGYGIDGCLSSFLGSAISCPHLPHYLVIGDLSFFYDLNALVNELPGNIHILLVNNGVGTEFKNYSHRAAYLGEDANDFVAAKGHNGFKNPELVRDLCTNIGLRYLSSSTKEEFLANQESWLNPKSGPVLLEAFTTDQEESDALRIMNHVYQDTSWKGKFKKTALGKIALKVLRRR